MLGFKLWKVEGESMSPLIPNGSFILTCRWLPLVAGSKLVIQHATYGLIVKTLVKSDDSGKLWCQGESESSVSAEQIGPVERVKVQARVLWIFKAQQQANGQLS